MKKVFTLLVGIGLIYACSPEEVEAPKFNGKIDLEKIQLKSKDTTRTDSTYYSPSYIEKDEIKNGDV
jgi:hypothetical protein